MLFIVNLDMGNLKSVTHAFQHIGASVNVTDCAADIERADAIVLPGVGAFGNGIDRLKEKGLVEPIRRAAQRRGVPILGICLGMQLLATTGEEYGYHRGLDLIPGRVVPLRPVPPYKRVPNIGWCAVQPTASGRSLFGGPNADEAYYFAHSYHMICCKEKNVAARMAWGDGTTIVAAVKRDNVEGVQFHPEKSQDAGLEVLHTFWTRVKDRNRTSP